MTEPTGAPTGDDGPAWSPDHIEATRNQVLPEQPTVLPGISDVTQDPDAVDLDIGEMLADGRARIVMGAAVPHGTATALILSARKNLGLGESPAGSNHNRITVWYNDHIARIGDGSWCDMSVTQEAYDSGTEVAVCGSNGKGFAYCPSHAGWFRSIGRWKYGGGDLKPGDIVFYQWNGHKTTVADHVGVVEKTFSDGSFYALEGNTSDVFARRHRDTTYVAGRGRPAYASNSTAQESDMPEYLSVTQKAPATGTGVHRINWDTTEKDTKKLRGDGKKATPGILIAGKAGAQFIATINLTGTGRARLVETDPTNKYAVHKSSYPWHQINGEGFTEGGLCDPGMHLWVQVDTTAPVTGHAKVSYWDL